MQFSCWEVFCIFTQNYLKFFYLTGRGLPKIIHEHEKYKVPMVAYDAFIHGTHRAPQTN